MKHRPNTRSILLPRGGPVGVSWHLDLDLTTFNFTPVFRNKNLVCRCRRLRRYSNILQPLRRFLVLQVGRDGIVPFDLNTSKSSPATPPFRPFSDRKYSRAHFEQVYCLTDDQMEQSRHLPDSRENSANQWRWLINHIQMNEVGFEQVLPPTS